MNLKDSKRVANFMDGIRQLEKKIYYNINPSAVNTGQCPLSMNIKKKISISFLDYSISSHYNSKLLVIKKQK